MTLLPEAQISLGQDLGYAPSCNCTPCYKIGELTEEGTGHLSMTKAYHWRMQEEVLCAILLPVR